MRVLKWLGAGVLAVIVLTSVCGSDSKRVPDVTGYYPQEAIEAIHDAGLDDTESHGGIGGEEGTGFAVCRTDPPAGVMADGVVNIYSSRKCQPRTPQARADRAEWTRARNAERAEQRAERRRAAARRRQAAARRERTREARAQARRDAKELRALLNAEDGGGSDPAPDYSDVVNCSDTTATDFPTPPGDPNGLDADGDGIACES
jgi:hypothetical protein